MTAALEQAQADPDVDDDGTGALQGLVGRELLGRYRLDELLSIGGTGAVFRAHQLTLKRDVAVKVLHPQLTRHDRMFKRFQREAESTARFEHPNIVQVMEAGSTEDGFHFIVMQLLDGAELHELLGAPFSPLRACGLMLQVFRGLEHAHERGVVHRDLKPENVFVTRDHEGAETIKLVDFGLAKLVEGAGEAEALTRLGMVFGTPAYMSPEQATGREVDHRTDLYSAGLIFYGLLAGRPPFLAEDPVELMRAQVKGVVPPLADEVPAELSELVHQLVAKAPAERPPSATWVRARLEELIPRMPATVERRRIVPLWLTAGLAGTLAAGLAVGSIALWGEPEAEPSPPPVQATTAPATVPAAKKPPPVVEGTAATVAEEPVPTPGPTPGAGPRVELKPAPPDDAGDTEGSEAASDGSEGTTSKPKAKSKAKAKKKKKKSGFKLGGFRRPGG